MTSPDEIGALVKKAFSEGSSEFRPCAFFDDRLDCIRVIVRDCSVLEERINNRITVLLDNYHPRPGQGGRKCVGFTIKGARHFCQERGWGAQTSVTMTDLLDAVVASSPEAVVGWFVDFVARPLVREEKIEEVEIGEEALQPA